MSALERASSFLRLVEESIQARLAGGLDGVAVVLVQGRGHNDHPPVAILCDGTTAETLAWAVGRGLRQLTFHTAPGTTGTALEDLVRGVREGYEHACAQGSLELQPDGLPAPATSSPATGPHPLAGKKVRVNGGVFAVEGWWCDVRPDDQNPLMPRSPVFALYVLRRGGGGLLPPPGVYGHFGDRGWILGDDELAGAEVIGT
jgi:hypothetical protein